MVSSKFDETAGESSLKYYLAGKDFIPQEPQIWRFTNKDIAREDAILVWNYGGSHALSKASIRVTIELKKASGAIDTYELLEGPRFGEFTGTGQIYLMLEEYSEYKIVIIGKNDKGDLSGTLKVKEMEVENGSVIWNVEQN